MGVEAVNMFCQAIRGELVGSLLQETAERPFTFLMGMEQCEDWTPVVTRRQWGGQGIGSWLHSCGFC